MVISCVSVCNSGLIYLIAIYTDVLTACLEMSFRLLYGKGKYQANSLPAVQIAPVL